MSLREPYRVVSLAPFVDALRAVSSPFSIPGHAVGTISTRNWNAV